MEEYFLAIRERQYCSRLTELTVYQKKNEKKHSATNKVIYS